MFVSSNFLAINYGVDDAIAKFFSDREPPADNLYWKDKLMYLRPEPGWLFIPLIADLLYKCGIEKSQLLSDDFISLMESIGHISAEEEMKIITYEQALNKYIDCAKGDCKNETYFKNLVDFMKGGTNNPFAIISTPFKALHRGDAFLFALCALQFDDRLQTKLVEHWFALISTLLLLDDAEDIEIDKHSGDENAFLESGSTKEGTEIIKEMVQKNLHLISLINKPMATTLDKKFISLAKKPDINALLNQ